MNPFVFSQTTIKNRQLRTESRLRKLNIDLGLILISSGNPMTKPGGLDQTYEFLPLPEYYWLTGLRRPEGVIAYHPDFGWQHFLRPVTKSEEIWEGLNPFNTDGTKDISELESWVRSFSEIVTIGDFSKTPGLERHINQSERLNLIQNAIDEERRIKDSEEIDLISKCAEIAKYGYDILPNLIRAGLSERQVQIEYEAEIFRNGSHKTPYDTIVGTGKRSAVLHAIPGSSIIQKNDLVLIDAGADLFDYCVDITRVFSESGKRSSQQQEIYDIVLKAQTASIAACFPETEWHEIHRISARIIGQGLIDLGLIKGDLESLLEQGVISLFFPHGVGHMVGQRVRDVGGRKWQRPPRTCYGNMVRVDLPLEAGFIMTVEPGLYFIESLLMAPENKNRFRDQINWSQIESWLSIGGIRLEDDILVTKSNPIILTSKIAK